MTDTLVPAGLQLPATVDAQAAEPLINQLAALRGQPLTIDASALAKLSGMGLQVLLSAKASWAADGQVLAVENLSPAVQASLALCGVASLATP
jgi:chemotaxis protein CheX